MNRFAKILGMALGVGIIIIGICLLSADTDSIGQWGTRFGADFYTEMYAVTQDVGYAVNDVTKAIHKCMGWLVIALGVVTSCYYFNSFAELCHSEKVKLEEDANTVSSEALPEL